MDSSSHMQPLYHGGLIMPVHPGSLENRQKWMISLAAAVLAVIVFSPFLFKLVNKLTSAVGLEVADSKGCPTLTGLLVHGVVYLLLVRLIMYEGREQGYEYDV